jgi:hypothetical protein
VCVLTKQAVQRAALDAALAVFNTSVRTLLLTACDTVLYQFLQVHTITLSTDITVGTLQQIERSVYNSGIHTRSERYDVSAVLSSVAVLS